ncbi:hypothetical protein ACLOJK_027132 [Asimina triloba]
MEASALYFTKLFKYVRVNLRRETKSFKHKSKLNSNPKKLSKLKHKMRKFKKKGMMNRFLVLFTIQLSRGQSKCMLMKEIM